MMLVKSLEYKSDEKWLSELWMLPLEKRRLGGDHVTLYIYLERGCSKVGVCLFSQVTAIGQGKMYQR